MQINEVEKLMGMSKKSIRYYEEQGLIKPLRNETNGYREYGENDIKQLKKIKLLRQMTLPINTINSILREDVSVKNALELHMGYLSKREKELGHVKGLCSSIIDEGDTIEDLDAERYLSQMDEIEEGGQKFMTIDEFNRKRIRGPVIAISVFSALMIGLFCLLLFALTAVPIWVFILLGISLLGPVLGGLICLVQRIKEIKGGEDYEASKY